MADREAADPGQGWTATELNRADYNQLKPGGYYVVVDRAPADRSDDHQAADCRSSRYA